MAGITQMKGAPFDWLIAVVTACALGWALIFVLGNNLIGWIAYGLAALSQFRWLQRVHEKTTTTRT
jgi:hypothetical protein